MGRVLNGLIKTNEGRNPFVGIPPLLTKTFFEFDLLMHTALAGGSWCGTERQRGGGSGSVLM